MIFVTITLNNNRTILRTAITPLTFVDFAKAYDTLNQTIVWETFKGMDLPAKLLQTLYENASCRIAYEDIVNEQMGIIIGVRQGCPLSPLLFILVIVNTIRHVTFQRRDMTLGLNGRLEYLSYVYRR